MRGPAIQRDTRRRHRAVALCFLSTAALLFAAGRATGDGLETRLVCPRSVGPSTVEACESAGSIPVELALRIENSSCEPMNVRVLSTIVGNGDETLGGVGVLGPVVAEPSVDVPGATDATGPCVSNTCEGTFIFCTTDADCACRVTSAVGQVDVAVAVPTPIPSSYCGTVVEQFVFTDFDEPGGTQTRSDRCRIFVPEAGAALQLAAALAAIALLPRRGRRTHPPKESR